MMTRKSQLYAIREVFQFTVGLFLLSGIIYLFYNMIVPEVRDYALTLEAHNVNSHVNYIIKSSVSAISNIDVVNISFKYDMPDDIAKYEYDIYFRGDKICTIFHGSTVDICDNYNINIPHQGYYISGGPLYINITKTLNSRSLRLSN